MTFENSAIRVEEPEVVRTPQPANVVMEEVDPIISNSPTHSVHNYNASGECDALIHSPTDNATVEPDDTSQTDPVLSGRETSAAAPVPLHVEVLLPDPDPRCPMCGMQVGKVSMLVKHFAIRHAANAILYKCRKCGRTNPNSHSISCHIPKCKGIVAEVDTNR